MESNKLELEEEFNPLLVEEEDISSYDKIDTKVDDSFRMYLTEIGRIPLLTQEEEYDLSRMVMEGNQAKTKLLELDKDSNGNMSIEAYEELKELAHKGEEAISRLVEANLRLVVSIAKHYKHDRMDIMDLIQEGTLGLMKAAEKFDYTTGYRFSTYATWWIRQSIVRCIADQSRTIRIPVHVTEDLRRINTAKKNLTQELNREPSVDELSIYLDMPKERILQYLSYQSTCVSMDTKVGDDEDSTLSDFISDEHTKSPLQYTMAEKLKMEIEAILKQVLTDKERMVIELRFGINGQNQNTLEEIAARPDYTVTRERIRQIEAKAMSKLRHSDKFKELAMAYLSQKNK